MLLLLACTTGPSDIRDSKPRGTPGPEDEPTDTLPGAPTVWPALSITEAMSDNGGSLEDGDGDTPDWIEIFHPGPGVVDLQGWVLADASSSWTFHELAMPPGGFLVVFASGKGDAGPERELHTDFALDHDGERVTLSSPDGALVSFLDLPALAEEQSFGRSQTVASQTAIADGSAAFTTLEPDDDWTEPGLDDAAWTEVVLPVGYDGPLADGEDTDVGYGASATESSDYPGFSASGAVDGDSFTISHTKTGDLAPWIEVDLGSAYAVDSVRLLNRADCCGARLYNITVDILDDVGAPVWTSAVQNPVAEGTAPVSPGDEIDVAVPDGTVGRRVHVSKDAMAGSEWLSLAEVVVMARQSEPYASRIGTEVSADLDAVALRVPFALDAATPTRAVLSVDYDDAFHAWLEGIEVASIAPVVAHAAGVAENFVVDAQGLSAGPALLALEAENAGGDEDDLFLGATLRFDWIATAGPAYLVTPTPGAPNGIGVAGTLPVPSLDPPRGFYDAPQTVHMSVQPGAMLVYTLDGSTPTREHGTVVESGDPVAAVEVDTTSIVRAAAFLDGWADSAVATHTYLFLGDVVRQSAAPVGFPAVWNSISEGPYAADYEMDPDVVDDPVTHEALVSGLREIPTLSIAMDEADLFGDDGIYTNSAERGDEWVRRASLELLLPDGGTGFAEDSDLEIHGYGWRYHSPTLKHSFRLEFRSEYGASKLTYPLFADSPADELDSIVLRAGGSKTFLDFRDPEMAQYIADAFARDTARDMGEIDGHATYVHLYLNGLYWGLYMPVERPDADFAAEYFGGDDDDYDAINRRTTVNEAIDGDLNAYDEMLELADADLAVPANYEALVANLDLDALVDYMLIHQYMTNADGPCCFGSNNMRGARKRATDEDWHFFVWDMEYSLWYPDDAYDVDIDVAGSISHVYTRLRTVPEFRHLYAERARLHLTHGGALTPEIAAARYDVRAEEIYDAVLAESARWGDTYRTVPYTRDVEWQAERDRLMGTYFPHRTDALISQLVAAGLWDE